ncbi:MAG TPA: hypothetical protein DDY37_03500 [Legionella sp.]|nr:hypothetical protein [Legionella sp.]
MLNHMKVWLPKLYQYKEQVNTHDLLKVLAVIAMTIDHLGAYRWDDDIWLRIIGRLAAPLFFFAFGTTKSRSFNDNILIGGVLITATYFWMESRFVINILVNFAFIKYILNRITPSLLTTTSLIILNLMSIFLLPITVIFIEYGTVGLLFAVSGHLIARGDKRGQYFMLSTLCIYFLEEGVLLNIDSNRAYAVGLLSVCLLLAWIYTVYVLKFWPIPTTLIKPCLFFSRYSLYIYMFQVLLGDLGVWRACAF